jgi:hypothetical protein
MHFTRLHGRQTQKKTMFTVAVVRNNISEERNASICVGARLNQQVTPKGKYFFTRLHGVTSQKATILQNCTFWVNAIFGYAVARRICAPISLGLVYSVLISEV